MDPNSGRYYTAEEAAKLPEEVRARLETTFITPEEAKRRNRHIKEIKTRSEDKRRNAKKTARSSRKRNRK